MVIWNTIGWDTSLDAERARHNLRLKKKKKIKKRVRAQARKRSSVFPTGNVNWFKKKMDRDQA